MDITAIVCTGPHQVALQTARIPDHLEGAQVLVEKTYACASPGTDGRCIALAQPGATKPPFILGYSSVGRITAVGPDASLPVGTRVFAGNSDRVDMPVCWGAYSSHAVHEEGELYVIPDGVADEQAALTKLAAIAYHGLTLARPLPHHRVAVVGLGMIGQLSARLFQATGAAVVAADPQERRRTLAAAHGIGLAVDAENDLLRAFAGAQPDGADIVVDATGAPAVLPLSAQLARSQPWDGGYQPPPCLLLQGSYPSMFSVDYNDLFMREMPILVPRDTRPADYRAVLDLMARGRLRVDDLTTDIRPASACQEAYDDLRRPDAPNMTTLFSWAV